MAGWINWHGDNFKRQLNAELRKNLEAASIYLEKQVKADISQEGILRYEVQPKKPRKTPPKSIRQKTIYNFTHSVPGNPPFKQTGHLRRSITHEITGWARRPIGRVGSNLVYARPLELGNPKRGLKPRPYLRSNLRKWSPQITAILTRRVDAGLLGGAIGSRIGSQQRSGVLGRGAYQAGIIR